MTAPIKTCNFCLKTGVMPTFLDGTTICAACFSTMPHDLFNCWKEITALRAEVGKLKYANTVLEENYTSCKRKIRSLRDGLTYQAKRHAQELQDLQPAPPTAPEQEDIIILFVIGRDGE